MGDETERFEADLYNFQDSNAREEEEGDLMDNTKYHLKEKNNRNNSKHNEKTSKNNIDSERKEKEAVLEILNVGREVKISSKNNNVNAKENLNENYHDKENSDQGEELSHANDINYKTYENEKENDNPINTIYSENKINSTSNRNRNTNKSNLQDNDTHKLKSNVNVDNNTNQANISYEDSNLKLQNKHLKQQILLLSSKIGDYISSIKSKTNQNPSNNVQSTLSHYKQDFNNFSIIQKEIAFYKENISRLKVQMEGVYNASKIEALENELKVKKDRYTKLKQEEQILESIQKNHVKVIEDLEDKYENKNEVNLIKLKIQTQKEELKMKKELLKSQENKIKEMNSQIYNIEVKTKSIKDKLEYIKSNKSVPVLEENEIFELENKIKEAEEKFSNNEKSFKNEGNIQQLMIKKLEDENEILNSKLKERSKLARLSELKLKELEKIVRIMEDNKSGNNINTKEEHNSKGYPINTGNRAHERAISAKTKLKQPNKNYLIEGSPKLVQRVNMTPGVMGYIVPDEKNKYSQNNYQSNKIGNSSKYPNYLSVKSLSKQKYSVKPNIPHSSILPKSRTVINNNTNNTNNSRFKSNQDIDTEGNFSNTQEFKQTNPSNLSNPNSKNEVKKEKEQYKNQMLSRIEMLKHEVEDLIRCNDSNSNFQSDH